MSPFPQAPEFDKSHKWRIGTWPGLRIVLFGLTVGGTQPWSRWRYFRWICRQMLWKWLKAPWSCKRGVHRINDDSGMCQGQERGTVTVWCTDCDAMLIVPIDDVIGWWKADKRLATWKNRAT